MKSRWLASKTFWAVARKSDGVAVILCDSRSQAVEVIGSNPDLELTKVRKSG